MPSATLTLPGWRRATGAAVLLTAATTACTEHTAEDRVIQLRSFASTGAPPSMSGQVALVSERVACLVDSFEHRIHCLNSSRRAVGVFGREGEGPGEFRGPPWVMRGPAGMVAALDLSSAQLTFFEPDGTLVSATRLPPGVYLTDLRDDRALGSRLTMPDRTRSEDQPDEVPVVVDAVSGEVLWEREDPSGAVGRDCFNGRVGILNPQGGIVPTACEHEIVFLDHEDATNATVVAAPNYSPLLPSNRSTPARCASATG